jgi:uncharacterized protein with NRDE domain
VCLIAIAWRQSARYPLVIAANRDEYHARPTQPAQEWPDAPGIFGGRDLRAGGSWMAFSAGGRLAAVTNVREAARKSEGRSRGELVRDYLLNGAGAVAAAEALVDTRAAAYGPFNLLLSDGEALVHVTNRPVPAWRRLQPGVHGVSNGGLHPEWPKVRRLKREMQTFLGELEQRAWPPDSSSLFGVLGDSTAAAASELPDTGVGVELERQLSPVFVTGDEYGTRASSVAMVAADGASLLIERNFGPAGLYLEERSVEWCAQLR